MSLSEQEETCEFCGCPVIGLTVVGGGAKAFSEKRRQAIKQVHNQAGDKS